MKTYLFVALLAAGVFGGCSKDGAIGPQGEKGIQGEKGEQGVKGIDGTTILSGVTAPSTSIGIVGDYYIDLNTKNFYGPKTANLWGNPTSLKGDKGDTGNDGSKIYSGEGTPSGTLGINGDFYFSKQELSFYGPKTSAGWGNPLVIGSSKNAGVQVFLIKNVKFNIAANQDTEYNLTKPWFYYKNTEVNLGQTNIKKGLYTMYWRYNGQQKDNNMNASNYFDYDWNILEEGRGDQSVSYGDIIAEMRIEPFRTGINPQQNNNVIQWLLVGGFFLNTERVAGNAEVFNEFKNTTTFDILIKYIPESSVTVIGKNNKQIKELLSIKSK